MPRALVDTSVLFGAAYRRDESNEDALPILHGFDDGSLSEPVVLDYVLAETLTGLTTPAGHTAAVEFLDRLEENARFHLVTPTNDGLATAKAHFRARPSFSFVGACIVAYMRTEGLGYLYAFDDGFDRIDDVYRLDTPTNPYEPQ